MIPFDADYATLCIKLTQCYGTEYAMIETQNELAQLWLRDQTFWQLALKMQQLAVVAFRGADEGVRMHFCRPFPLS